MEVKIKVNDYNKQEGLKLNWAENYKIEVIYNHGEIVISANEDGLLSLANHLVTLSQSEVPIGTHIHLDEYNSLEEGSAEVVIQKINWQIYKIHYDKVLFS